MSSPPTSVSLACWELNLGSYLVAVGGVLLVVLHEGPTWLLGLFGVGLAAVLLMISRLLWRGDRSAWQAALVVLSVATVLGAAGRTPTALATALPLACLLTPSARRYYRTPTTVTAPAEAPSEP